MVSLIYRQAGRFLSSSLFHVLHIFWCPCWTSWLPLYYKVESAARYSLTIQFNSAMDNILFYPHRPAVRTARWGATQEPSQQRTSGVHHHFHGYYYIVAWCGSTLRCDHSTNPITSSPLAHLQSNETRELFIGPYQVRRADSIARRSSYMAMNKVQYTLFEMRYVKPLKWLLVVLVISGHKSHYLYAYNILKNNTH